MPFDQMRQHLLNKPSDTSLNVNFKHLTTGTNGKPVNANSWTNFTTSECSVNHVNYLQMPYSLGHTGNIKSDVMAIDDPETVAMGLNVLPHYYMQ